MSEAGSSPTRPRALLFSRRVPLSLQLTRHWGQLVRSTQGMFPHSFCYRGDKKRKIETPEGPANNFTHEPSANVVSGSWEGFHVPPLKVKGQCAHLRCRKAIVGAVLRASCQPSIWEWNCWAEQQAESSSLRRAGRWLLLRRVCNGDNSEVKAWGQGGGWEGAIGEEVFSPTRSPTGRFPEDGKCCLRAVHTAHLISYMLSPSICYQTLLGMLGLSGLTVLVSMTPLSNVLQTLRHLSWNTALLQKLLTNSQCPHGVCVGGGSLTVGQHLGFLNTGGLLLTSKGRYPQKWQSGAGGQARLGLVAQGKIVGTQRSQTGSQPRAAPDRQQGSVQFVPLERCLLCLGEKLCLCLPPCLWVSHDQGCCFSHPVSHSSSPFLSGVESTHTYRVLQPFALMFFLIYFMGCSKSNPLASSSALQDHVTALPKINMKGVK